MPDAEPTPPRRRRLFRRASAGDGVVHANGAGAGRQSPEAEGSEQERFIIEALADLRDMDVREVMTPRVDVTYLTIPVHADDIARAVRTSGHSCFPVVHDDLDDLIGILFVNDIFRTGGQRGARAASSTPGDPDGDAIPEDRSGSGTDAERDRDATDPSPLEISRKVRAPYLLPESLKILEALADMRKHRRAVAVVVDEYGGVAGLLTVKDLLEPLVGDLHDEFDEGEEANIVRVDNTRWLVDGQTNVDDVRERLGIEIPDGEYVTVGGLLFERFGHIPTAGEEVRVGDWDFKVAEMDKRRVAQVVATFARRGPGSTHPADERSGETDPPSANGSGEAGT